MATCPACESKDHMSVSTTNRTKLVARPIGTWSLAGEQDKTSAIEVAVLVLACDPEVGGCGWAIDGYIAGNEFIAFMGQDK